MFSDAALLGHDRHAPQRRHTRLPRRAALFGALPSGKWMGKLYYYDSERGIPGAIVNNVWKNSQRQWDRNFFAQGTFQKQLTDRYEILAGAKYARDYMHYLNPDTTLMYVNNRFNQDELYVTVAQKYALSRRWEVSLSTDWQWNHLESDMVNFVQPHRHTLLAALATALDLDVFKVQGSLLGTFVWDRTRLHRKNLAKFSPAIFVQYAPWGEESLTVRAFFKRAFRMPTFNDLYYTDIGNADLKPEYATQYNVGLGWKPVFHGALFTYLHLTADGYHNCISDKIIAVPKGTGQYRWMMMNIGRVRIWGLDLTAPDRDAAPRRHKPHGTPELHLPERPGLLRPRRLSGRRRHLQGPDSLHTQAQRLRERRGKLAQPDLSYSFI